MIRVLVVDDQRLTARAHRTLVDRVPGFRTVGVVHDGSSALERARGGGTDLVLLDLAMPGMHGIDVCRQMQLIEDPPDVIVVSAVRDIDSVRTAVRYGAVNYLLKPFTFAMLRDKLDRYAAYRAVAAGHRDVTDQGEIDAALGILRGADGADVPKGMSRETLDTIREALVAAPTSLTASQAAHLTGTSRVTARRYLEHLVTVGGCLREPVYGRRGRPEMSYRPHPAE